MHVATRNFLFSNRHSYDFCCFLFGFFCWWLPYNIFPYVKPDSLIFTLTQAQNIIWEMKRFHKHNHAITNRQYFYFHSVNTHDCQCVSAKEIFFLRRLIVQKFLYLRSDVRNFAKFVTKVFWIWHEPLRSMKSNGKVSKLCSSTMSSFRRFFLFYNSFHHFNSFVFSLFLKINKPCEIKLADAIYLEVTGFQIVSRTKKNLPKTLSSLFRRTLQKTSWHAQILLQMSSLLSIFKHLKDFGFAMKTQRLFLANLLLKIKLFWIKLSRVLWNKIFNFGWKNWYFVSLSLEISSLVHFWNHFCPGNFLFCLSRSSVGWMVMDKKTDDCKTLI